VSADGWKMEAMLCVDRFAKRLLESPLLDEHPAPLIVKERDRMLQEIQDMELPEPRVSPPIHVNGNGRKKIRA
jgi:hypothetical protein